MCGIAGVFGRGDRGTVGAMLDALVHRGPDDAHVVGSGDFSLGARRLSIVDVDGGRQPMANEAGTIWAALNGELYDFQAVGQRLRRGGHQLHTRCDTEILPHLYEEHAAAVPDHVEGMFAFAVWDDERKIGILARDRVGKKPLYYHVRGGALYFASEIKALLKVPGFERRINLEALHHFLGHKHVPSPLSMFEGIHALPPAHVLVFSPRQPLSVRRYWQADFSATNGISHLAEEDQVDRFLALLRRAVERRLVSDVPIGFFLSGGIDSSLTTALGAELSNGPIKTFTLTYANGATTPEKELDRDWARRISTRYGTEHHEETIDAGAFPEHLQDITGCFDEPFAGVTSTYFLSRLIARHVKVALSGDGADELFGSYLSHRLAFPLANYASYLSTGDASLIRPFEEQPEFLARLAASEQWQWREKLLVFKDAEKGALYAPDVARAAAGFSTRDRLSADFSGLTATDPLNGILEAEFRTLLPDQVLTFVDRLSMAHSLEVRAPFLDTDVVTFVAGLPGKVKIKNAETKYLLKQAARRYFPDEMVFRPKEGFVMPVNRWLVTELRPYVYDTLAPARLATHGVFDASAVAQLVDEFYAGRDGHATKILTLLAFQQWFELYRPGSA